jgi:gas vesicle protein
MDIKFNKGDTVYFASTYTTQKFRDCPDCLGKKAWSVTSPAGDEYTFSCPRCGGSYQYHHELSLGYTEFAPKVERMTVGSVRFDSNDDDPVSYMCEETGVGSGSVYRQGQLFSTEQEAAVEAEIIAKRRNKEDEQIKRCRLRAISISDYKLSNALIHLAQEHRKQTERFIDDFEDAIELSWSAEEIKEHLKEAKEKRSEAA